MSSGSDALIADLGLDEREYLEARWGRGVSLDEPSYETRYRYSNSALAWPRKQIITLIHRKVLRRVGENQFALTPLGQEVVRGLRELGEAHEAAGIWRKYGD